MFKTEQEMAQRVVTWLREVHKYQVFQEVPVEGSNKRLDIAALRGDGKLWAISCKLRAKKAGLKDARWWQKHSNVTSLLLPYKYDIKFVIECAVHGVGLIYVNSQDISVAVDPAYRKQRTEDLFCKLNPKTADFAKAGMASGKRESDFNVTLQAMGNYLLSHPDSSIEDAYDYVRDRSWLGRKNYEDALRLEIKKSNYPGLYLRKGKVERKIEVGK